VGILRAEVSDTSLRTEYEKLTRRLLERAVDSPARRPDEVLDSAIHPEALRLCRRNWQRRMIQEHQSAQVFSSMLPDLIEAEATIDVKVCVLRSAMDELHHAALCADVVSYLGGVPEVETNLQLPPIAPHPGVPALERSLRNLFFVGCLSETVAVSLLTEERELVKDPYVARVLKQLAGDETLHARIGWVYLREVWPTLDEAARERTIEYLYVALAYYEKCMVDATPFASIPPIILAEARSIGFADCRESRALFYETMESVIIPQLEEIGLPARKAWDARASATSTNKVGDVTLTG